MYFFLGSTPGNFDIVVHNADLETAYKELHDFVTSELEAQKKAGISVNLTKKKCI